MVVVDESWTKKQLQDECKRRGLGYSGKNKAALIRALKTGGTRNGYVPSASLFAVGVLANTDPSP